jgi:hypothetical protein
MIIHIFEIKAKTISSRIAALDALTFKSGITFRAKKG